MVILIGNTVIPVHGNEVIEVKVKYDYATQRFSVTLLINDYETKPHVFHVDDYGGIPVEKIDSDQLAKTILEILAGQIYNPVNQYANIKIKIDLIVEWAMNKIKDRISFIEGEFIK